MKYRILGKTRYKVSEGQAFDVGETFAGIDFEAGLLVVEKLKTIKPSQ